jgi:hypothetical protein
MTIGIERAEPELFAATYKGATVDQSGTKNRLAKIPRQQF